jgi:RNA polymerase-binding transcription factor DksA
VTKDEEEGENENEDSRQPVKPVIVQSPLQKAAAGSVRYSDKELKEFELLIHDKLKQAKSDLDELRRSLSHDGDNSTDDTSPTFKMMEDGSETMSKEEVAQLASRQEKFISALDNALLRIKNKTYGICRVTGKLIPKERLRLVPHATLSIEAKNMQS